MVVIITKGPSCNWPQYYLSTKAVPWLRQLVTGLSLWRPGLNSRLVCMGFLVGRVLEDRSFHRCSIITYLFLTLYNLSN